MTQRLRETWTEVQMRALHVSRRERAAMPPKPTRAPVCCIKHPRRVCSLTRKMCRHITTSTACLRGVGKSLRNFLKFSIFCREGYLTSSTSRGSSEELWTSKVLEDHGQVYLLATAEFKNTQGRNLWFYPRTALAGKRRVR